MPAPQAPYQQDNLNLHPIDNNGSSSCTQGRPNFADGDAASDSIPPSSSHCEESLDEEADVLDEIQGLDIGLDLLDQCEVDKDDILVLEDPLVSAPVPRHAVWDDLRTDYIRTYGTLPYEPPDFVHFLKRLRPYNDGRLECAPCSMEYNGVFYDDQIAGHFHHRHLGNITFADNGDRRPRVWAAIDHLMRDSEVQQIIKTLQDRCSEVRGKYLKRQSAQALRAARYKCRLPSITLFLSQQRVSCDGQLVCIGPKCKGLERFDASWEALQLHYENLHVAHLPQDETVEDELNVHKHLADHSRSISRLLEKARRRCCAWSSMDITAKEQEYASDEWKIKNEVLIYYQRLPQMPQFSVLRDLKNMFRSSYRKFFRFAREYSSDQMNAFAERLQEQCPTPVDLRRLGTETFKQVIRGIAPTTLLETFAFITLSEIMTTVMRRRGVQLDFDPRIVDYYLWRSNIKDEAEHDTYDKLLMSWFHPQYMNEKVSGWFLYDKFSAQEAMEKIVKQLLGTNKFCKSFNFSRFSRLNDFVKEHGVNEHTSAPESRHLTVDDAAPVPYPNENEASHPGRSITATLMTTIIFIRAHIFMIVIGCGVVLIYLSNENLLCHLTSASGEQHVATARSVLLAAENLKERIIRPLINDSRLSNLKDIFVDAGEVIDQGSLCSVADLHLYLEKEVQNRCLDPGLVLFSLTEIMEWCKRAFPL